MSRQVTEADFRRPEYLGADPKDYEFRADGVLVRKDRWERGIKEIINILDMDSREFEISEVVSRVREIYEFYVEVKIGDINDY